MAAALIGLAPLEWINVCLLTTDHLQHVETGILKLPQRGDTDATPEQVLRRVLLPSECISIRDFESKDTLLAFLEAPKTHLFYLLTYLGTFEDGHDQGRLPFRVRQSYEIHGTATHYHHYMYFHSSLTQMRCFPSRTLPIAREHPTATSMGAVHAADWLEEVLFKLGKRQKYGA
jgi:hypothetical protein